MTISEQIELVQALIDGLETLGVFVIIFGIGFLITGGEFGRLFSTKLNVDIINYGVPVKGLTLADLITSLAKHGYTCNQIGDDTISVYNPRNPKAGSIVYSYTAVDGEYSVMKVESAPDYFPTLYSAIMPMLDIYNETIYSIETGTTLTGADDEDFGKLVRKVSKGTAKKSAICCILLGAAFMLTSTGIGVWATDHYNQFSVKLQKGVEDAFDVNLNDTNYSYDDYSYDDDSDDTDKEAKGAPAKKSESSNNSNTTSQPKTTDITNNVDEVIPTDLYTADTQIDYYELGGRYEGGGYEDCSISMYTSFDDQYVGNIDVEYNGKTYSGQLEEVRTNVYKARCDDGSFLVLAVYTYDNLGVDDPAFALYINGEYVQYYALSEHYYS